MLQAILASPLVTSVIKLFLEAFAEAGIEWLGEFVERKEAEEKLRRKAIGKEENATLREIAETADAQSKVNAADRGGADDVARRLRDSLARRRLARPQGSGAGGNGG